jgi:hypothetical protein
VSNTVVRICLRVARDPLLVLNKPHITKSVCRFCDELVWVDPKQPVPSDLPKHTHELICTECAAADPNIGPTLAKNVLTAFVQQEFQGKTHWWVVDDGK